MLIKDGDWTLVTWDPKTGKQTWRRHEPDGGVTFRTDMPADETIEENLIARNAASNNWNGDWHRVASVPMNLFFARLQEAHSEGDERYISRWLNDSDNRAFRTKEGNV